MNQILYFHNFRYLRKRPGCYTVLLLAVIILVKNNIRPVGIFKTLLRFKSRSQTFSSNPFFFSCGKIFAQICIQKPGSVLFL